VQVGTSRNSSVSGGADYPFTLTQTRKYFFSCVSPSAARVHPSSELDDVDQANSRSMLTTRHRVTDTGEALEVETLSRKQWKPLEVRDHVNEEILESTRLPLEGPVASVRPDAPASEVRLNQLKHLGSISVLADREA
jgi:hypothetical protein